MKLSPRSPQLPYGGAPCSSCGSCESTCPKGAIEMKENKDGFLRPFIHLDRCINCKLCEKACKHLHESPQTKEGHESMYFGGFSKSADIRANATSGGIVTTLARHIIRSGGSAFVVTDTSLFDAHFTHITEESQLSSIQGSRYLQAFPNLVYKKVKEEVRRGRRVLFVGMPCQAQALRTYLQNEYDNLIVVDLACFGTPSRNLSRAWLRDFSKEGKCAVYIRHRSKWNGWRGHGSSITYETGEIEHISIGKDLFSDLFMSKLALNDSCYACDKSLSHRASDISVGDYWGNKEFGEADEKAGISSWVVHTPIGRQIMAELQKEQESISLSQADVERGNLGMQANHFTMPRKRAAFLRDLRTGTCSLLKHRYLKDPCNITLFNTVITLPSFMRHTVNFLKKARNVLFFKR